MGRAVSAKQRQRLRYIRVGLAWALPVRARLRVGPTGHQTLHAMQAWPLHARYLLTVEPSLYSDEDCTERTAAHRAPGRPWTAPAIETCSYSLEVPPGHAAHALWGDVPSGMPTEHRRQGSVVGLACKARVDDCETHSWRTGSTPMSIELSGS